MLFVDTSLLLSKAGEFGIALLPLVTLYVRKLVANKANITEAPKMPIMIEPVGGSEYAVWKWLRDRSDIPYDRLVLHKDGNITIEFRQDGEPRREALITKE